MRSVRFAGWFVALKQVIWNSSQVRSKTVMGPVPERPFSTYPGLKFCSTFCICLPMHCVENICVIISFFRGGGTTVFCKLELHVLRRENLA